MQRKRSAIGHSGLPFNCPYSVEDAQRFLEIVRLEPSSRVLDIGCGRAELLCRMIEAYGCDGTGVDLNAEALDTCRLKDTIRLHCRDLGDYLNSLDTCDNFDCIMCIGSLLHRQQQDLLAKLSSHLVKGGYLWIGEIVWLTCPTHAFLSDVGLLASDYPTVKGLKSWIDDVGCSTIHECIHRFDEYEAKLLANVRAWAETTDDVDAQSILEMSIKWNEMIRRHGAYDMWGFATIIATKE